MGRPNVIILRCVDVVKDGGCVLKRWMLCFVWGMIFFQAPIVDAREFLKEIEAHYSEGKIDDALEVARAFAEAHADSVAAHGFLGMLYAEAGQLDAAVAAFQKVVEIKPGSVRGYRDLALVFARQNKISQALSALDRGIGQSDEPALLLAERASLNSDLGKPREAIADFEAALKRRPDFIEVYQSLALTHIAGWRYPQCNRRYGSRSCRQSGQCDVDG